MIVHDEGRAEITGKAAQMKAVGQHGPAAFVFFPVLDDVNPCPQQWGGHGFHRAAEGKAVVLSIPHRPADLVKDRLSAKAWLYSSQSSFFLSRAIEVPVNALKVRLHSLLYLCKPLTMPHLCTDSLEHAGQPDYVV